MSRSRHAGIDWKRFYAALDRVRIQIPEPNPGDPNQLNEIAGLLAKVSNYRDTLDHTSRKIERRLGSIKNDVEIYTEKLRIERAHARQEQSLFIGCKNKEDRDAAIDIAVAPTSARLVTLRARLKQFEHAKHAVESSMNSLKAAKETLNGIRQIIMSEMENLR